MSYFKAARARAERRKSVWNLLLIPSFLLPWLLVWWVSVVHLGKLHRQLHPGREFVLLPEGMSGILMAIGPLLAWLAPAMIVANTLVSAIRPARRALDRDAASVPQADRSSANRALLKLSLLLTPAALLLGLIGAFAAW